jgi:formamidopyrimidine-DNA glycosylase
MPELPEVETVVRDLRPLLCGKRISGLRVSKRKLRQPWKQAWIPLIVGRRIDGVRRRGKWIIVELDAGSHLLVHLGMTGQFTVRLAKDTRESHTHLIFALDKGARELRFRDIRRFGSVRYGATPAELENHFRERLGPEPWDLDHAAWFGQWKESRRSLKAILLDQTIVAGVGNIYADESLFEAGLLPTQLGTATNLSQAERLRVAILTVLNRAIAARGTTISDYVGGSGLQGGFQFELSVYGRAGLPCLRCGEKIASMRLAGRSTHWCPNCQKQSRAKTNSRRGRALAAC